MERQPMPVASDQSRSTRKARSAWIKIYPVKNQLLQFMDFYRTLYVFWKSVSWRACISDSKETGCVVVV